ncbi:glycoside hydrolase family 16 protein [Streptomyces sp. NPDC049597]|uniref:glycoside hydrolase family 16 protein n=1 Tax=Streptomyces sp. NPDC049597 TaxID=3155276 RepID=UPI00343F7DB4
MTEGKPVINPVGKQGYILEFDESFHGDDLDSSRWLPYYLPHWSSREAARARYHIEQGALNLLIEEEQKPWCPEFDGDIRVSSLQTGLFAGPIGSPIGQMHFKPSLRVREAQDPLKLYTPQYGFFEMRAKATADPHCMVALWMIGYEDVPEHSAEICIFEIFGRELTPDTTAVGMGLHPWSDPTIHEEWAAEHLAIDAREYHTYAVEWTPDHVAFFVDDKLVKVSNQSPSYPMQFMLSIYEFPEGRQVASSYPKRFTVDYFRGYRAAPAPG